MAHITEIKIDGLLGRKDQIHLKFRRDVNVIFGENGGGKTTLLKILDAAMSLDAESLKDLPLTRAEVHIFSASDKKIRKHVWERPTLKASGRVQMQFLSELSKQERAHFLEARQEASAWKVTPALARDIGRWAHTFLPTTRLYLNEAKGATPAKITERQFDEQFAENLNRSWLLYSSEVLRKVREIQAEGLKTVLHYALGHQTNLELMPKVLDPIQAYARVTKFLGRQSSSSANILGSQKSFVARYMSEENLRRIVDNLDHIEGRIESAMIPIERFQETVRSLFSKGKNLHFDTNQLHVKLDNGNLLSTANLSSGEKHILKILLAAMTANENSVIIDEPELSMHIDWQRVLVRTMQTLNPDCQLILASHSPEIMAEIPDENIFRI